MELLSTFVQKVKSELEKESIKTGYIGFNDFPNGSCMDASILLGILLERNGYGIFNLVSGWNETGRNFSHAWLENEKYLIDITAGQFPEWPAQSSVIKRINIPDHYRSFEIRLNGPVMEHKNVPDLGFHSAMRRIAEATTQ